MVKSHYWVELDLLGDHDLVKQVVRDKAIIDGHSTSLYSQISVVLWLYFCARRDFRYVAVARIGDGFRHYDSVGESRASGWYDSRRHQPR